MKTAIVAKLRVLRLKHVQRRIGVGRSTIYDLINPRSTRFDAIFSRPIKSVRGQLAGWNQN